jgi:tetratricopeptide (TPR) repeat protein
MGVVYLAEQQRPRREVALKVIRPGLATPAMLRRFEYESEVLGRLDHPGIARIYEAGVAETGLGPQPYFAMELVRGRCLDDYVRDVKPLVSRRLELLVEICQAVHHAHTKGVIHRDLKPSNILITEEGKPKILDFGVARAIDSDVQTTTTLATESGQLVGTLPYMAPEQAAGKLRELDTSSDVYALGVVAYELLSGKLPYALEGKPLHEAVRVICESEPSRLSGLDKALRGDIETIVQKALEKDKARRYHTAGELAADVKRFLDYEPIAARPPSTWYQLAKFTRRNKLLVSSVSIIMLLLAASAITCGLLLVQAQRQKREAVQSKAGAEATIRFLTNEVLAGAAPDRLPDRNTRDAIVSAMLDPAAASVGRRFPGQPQIEAAVRTELALSYQKLGRADLALPHARTAVELLQRHLGDENLETLRAKVTLAATFEAIGNWPESEALLRQILEARRRLLGEHDVETLQAMNNLGNTLHHEGKAGEAEALMRAAVAGYRRARGDNDPDMLTMISNLAGVLHDEAKYAEAVALSREAVEGRRRVLGEKHPDTIAAENNYGQMLVASGGDLVEAEDVLRKAVAAAREVLGKHPATLIAINNLAAVLDARGNYSEGVPLAREALELSRQLLGDDHPSTLTSMYTMAGLLEKANRRDEAEPILREALAKRRRILGEDHPLTIRTIAFLGLLLTEENKLDQAEPLVREALDRSRRGLGPDHPDTLIALGDLASFLRAKGEYREVIPVLREQLSVRRRLFGNLHADTLLTINNLGFVLMQMDQLQEAETLLREGLQGRLQVLGENHPYTVKSLDSLATCLTKQGRFADAEPMLAELCQRAPEAQLPPKSVAGYIRDYGLCLVQLKRYPKAEQQLRDAQRRYRELGDDSSKSVQRIIAAMVDVCDHTNRPDEAAHWGAELAALKSSSATRASTTNPIAPMTARDERAATRAVP